MNYAVALLVNLNFWFIGALPLVFFRRDGGLNLRWWFTALPLFVAPTLVAVAALFSVALPWTLGLGVTQEILAVSLSMTSVALIGYTLGSHRTRLALWHQDNDAPESIVTIGAYNRIRHPFYTSFLLAMAAAACALPSVVLMLSLIWSFTILNKTAAGEEKKLLSSQFGREYAAYLRRTGRFFPRLGRAPTTTAALGN